MSDSRSSSRTRKRSRRPHGPHRPASRVPGFVGPQRRRTPTRRSRSRSRTPHSRPIGPVYRGSQVASLKYSKPIGPSPKPKTPGWKTWVKSKAKHAGKYAYSKARHAGKYAYSRAKSSVKRAGKYAYSRARSKYGRVKSVARNRALTDLRRVCGKIESLLEKGHTMESIEKKLA